jgi:hypothetical protein
MRNEKGRVMSNREMEEAGIGLTDEDYEQGKIEASGGRQITYSKLKPGRGVGVFHPKVEVPKEESEEPKQEVIPLQRPEAPEQRKAA